MTDSLARKMLTAAALLAAPLVILIFVFVADVRIRVLALALALATVAVAWLFGQLLGRRLRALAAVTDGMLDRSEAATALVAGDDELGELTHSLSHIASRIAERIGSLSLELARRDAVLASMTEAVLAVDAQLNLTFWNGSFQQAVGDHTAPGIPLIRVVRHPELLGLVKQVLDSREPALRRIHLSGRSYEVNAAPLAGSTARGAIAILHDITPQEHLERVKRDFIANVSHEFRTPLATIRGYAETLLDGGIEDVENRRKFVEIIQANAIRLNNIAADLLTLSDLEAGRPEPEPGPISVPDAVSAALRAVEPAARLRGLALHCAEIPAVCALGYGIRFEQALLNLLDNAVKFNRDGGAVGIEVKRLPEGRIEVAIWDTGIGIPAFDLSRIFERFYRVDKARSRQAGGTGLGLSIVKHAIEQMNGTIAVESVPGEGSRFTITLPDYAAR